jgi:hypothetical protein
MAPPAPARVSTMKGWPKAPASPSATVRASRSAAPPGANVLTIRTGRVGQAYVCAAADDKPAAASPRSRARLRFTLTSMIWCSEPFLGALAIAMKSRICGVIDKSRALHPHAQSAIGSVRSNDILLRTLESTKWRRTRSPPNQPMKTHFSIQASNRSALLRASRLLGSQAMRDACPFFYWKFFSERGSILT